MAEVSADRSGRIFACILPPRIPISAAPGREARNRLLCDAGHRRFRAAERLCCGMNPRIASYVRWRLLALLGLLRRGAARCRRQATAQPASVVVEYRDLDRFATAEGVVEAVRQSTLAAQVAGRIVALPVKAGDAVKAGQVLVQIDRAQRGAGRSGEPEPGAGGAAPISPTRRRSTSAAGSCSRRSSSARRRSTRPRPSTSPRRRRRRRRSPTPARSATSKSFTTIVAPVRRRGRRDRGRSRRHGDDGAAARHRVRSARAARHRDAAAGGARAGEARRADERRDPDARARRSSRRRVTVIPVADTRTHTTRVRLDLPEAAGLHARPVRAGADRDRTHASARDSRVGGAAAQRSDRRLRDRRARRARSCGRCASARPRARAWSRCSRASTPGERVALEPVRAGIEASRGGDRAVVTRAWRRVHAIKRTASHRMGISGRIARFFLESRLTPLIALCCAAARRVRDRGDAARGGAADQRHDGERARAVSRARRRGTSRRWSRSPPSRCSRRSRASSTSTRCRSPGMAIDHRAVQGRRAAHRGAGAAVRHDPCRNRDWLPKELGVGEPLIKPKGIDDVPIVALTLWTTDADARRVRARARRARGRGRAEARARHARGDDDRRPGARRARAARRRAGSPRSGSTAADVRAALHVGQHARCPSGKLVARQPDGSASRPASSSQSAQDVRELVVGVARRRSGLPRRCRARRRRPAAAGALRLARHRPRRGAQEAIDAAASFRR